MKGQVNRAASTAVLSLIVLSPAHVALSAPHGATGDSTTNWTAHNGTADEQAYSGLDRIDTANVHRLGLAWSLDLEGEATLEGTPLAIDGILYFTGSY